MLTLHHASGSYKLPVHLAAQASQMLNFSDIVASASRKPDAAGNLVSADTALSGSARISGIRADNEHILVGLDAGTYNVRKATCSYYCISCDGAVNALIGEPIGFAAGSQQQLSFLVHESTGYNYDYAYEGNWSSDTPSVSTIDPQGLATGVSPGSFAASGFVNTDLYNTYYCAYNVMCPDFGTVYASGGGSVGNSAPLISSDCSTPNSTALASWGVYGGCNLTSPYYFRSQGEACVPSPGKYGTKNCAQSTSANCTTTSCPIDDRAINSSCTAFADGITNAYTQVTICNP